MSEKAGLLYNSDMENREIKADSAEEKRLRQELESKHDFDSERLKRWLALPDLTRQAGHPIAEMVRRILAIPRYDDFFRIEAPEIVRADISFDLFDFAADHPARSASDTYFVDKENILRTHTTVMWCYLFQDERVKKLMAEGKSFGGVSFGKVYRRDEIDRFHSNVFHQFDGVWFCRKEEKNLGVEDLQQVLIEIAQAIYGKDIEYNFKEDTFPYTNPSLEMNIMKDGRWVEVLGSGVVNPKVIANFGADPNVYNGWAFGFGLERLAILSMNLPDIRLLRSEDERVKKQLILGNNYKEVSKYPPIERDISFFINGDFAPNEYFDMIRDLGGELVEEVTQIDKYENPAQPGKTSYTFRIVYRASDRTLTKPEVDEIQNKVIAETGSRFKAAIR